MAVAPVEIGLRGLGGDVNNPALFIQRLTGPRHQAGSRFVGFSGPGIVAQLIRTGKEKKHPRPQAGPDIERANSARASETADDQEIFIRDAWRIQADSRRPLHVKPCAKVDGTILTKAPDDLARFWVEGIEIVANPSEKPLLATGFILPKHQAALPGATCATPLGLSVPFPNFPTGAGVERDDPACRRGSVKHAGNNEIVRLVFALVTGVEGPGDFQLSDIAPIDLLERRVKASPVVTQIT